MLKSFFCEKIQQLSISEAEKIFRTITQQLVFNAYEISKEIDVFVAFETMNNRGKPLTNLELLKNRLIYLSAHLPNNSDNIKVRRDINEAWKSVYHYLGKNDKRLLKDDDFLGSHLFIYYNKEINKKPVKDEDDSYLHMRKLERIVDRAGDFLLGKVFVRRRRNNTGEELPEITCKEIHKYSLDLKRTVEIYYKLSTPQDGNFKPEECLLLERICRLLGYSPRHSTLAVYIKEHDAKKRINYLKSYEKLAFLATLRFGRISSVEKNMITEHAKYIKDEITIEQLTTSYNNISSSWLKEDTSLEIISDWVKGSQGYYGWKAINYFLYEYESHLQKKSKSSRIKIDWDVFSSEIFDDNYTSIEHIYPQRAREKYWTDRFAKFKPHEKKLLRNSLGNLLALSQPKNSSLSNKPFPDKVGDDTNKVGYRYGSYSEIEVSSCREWDEYEILKRGILMLNFLEEYWSIPLGTFEQKVKALGLSFLLKTMTAEQIEKITRK
ncbi:DUF262 domain-containing protein [Rheinheimera tilapiae]|uniref:DUF262 domain-containing protein n=1 Tax=Rheinheimera tilapiae TaxID=875043 RepID=A0ABV6BG26_9GAMM